MSDYEIAIKRIEKMQNQLEKISAEMKACRNELCIKCGNYKEAHLGACDKCRWK